MKKTDILIDSGTITKRLSIVKSQSAITTFFQVTYTTIAQKFKYAT